MPIGPEMSSPPRRKWTICSTASGSELVAMSDFAGNEDLLKDFFTEASELLDDVDNQLIALERSPQESAHLNAVFRHFHTIKGGAGFLGATELVKLCHLTENLFDLLRNGELKLERSRMDTILAATDEVRRMFGELAESRQPSSAPAALLRALEAALTSEPRSSADEFARASGPQDGPDWAELLRALVDPEASRRYPSYGRRASDL